MGLWDEYHERRRTAERFKYDFPSEAVEKPSKRRRQTPAWIEFESGKIMVEGRLWSSAIEHFEMLMHHYNAKKRDSSNNVLRELVCPSVRVDIADVQEKRVKKILKEQTIPIACSGDYRYTTVPGGHAYCGFRGSGCNECPVRSKWSHPFQLDGSHVGGREHLCNYKN